MFDKISSRAIYVDKYTEKSLFLPLTGAYLSGLMQFEIFFGIYGNI